MPLRSRPFAAFVSVATAASLLSLASPFTAAATVSGGLDPTYGTNGVVTVPPGPFQGRFAISAAVDPQGRALLAVSPGGGTSWQVVRYTADGVLDAAFGTGGYVNFPAAFSLTIHMEATAQGIVVDGYASVGGISQPAVWRLNADGTPDLTAGPGGVVVLAPSDGTAGGSYAADATVEPDGSIVAIVQNNSTSTQDHYLVERRHPDGTVDTAFGSGGTVRMNPPVGWHNDLSFALSVDPTGRITVADSAAQNADGTGNSLGSLKRLLPNGAPDPTFGQAGTVSLGNGGAPVLTFDPHDGSTLAAGRDGANTAVWRVTPGGRLDVAFGAGGEATAAPSTAGAFIADAVAVLPSGHIAVLSTKSYPNQGSVLSILRPDGQLETAFGDAGIVTEPDQFVFGGLGVGTAGRVLVATGVQNHAPDAGVLAYSTTLPTTIPVISSVQARPGGLTVSWMPPVEPPFGPVKAYLLTASHGGTVSAWQAVAADVTTASLSGLVNGTTYQVAVQPYSLAGREYPSAAVDATPSATGPVDTVPGPVRTLTATPGGGYATVSWAPPGDDGGAPISTYSVIAINHSTGALAAWRNLPADVRTAAVPALSNGTSYDLYVLADNSMGFGQVAPAVETTPSASGVTSQPPTIPWSSAVAVGSNAVVTWAPPVEHGQTATHVNVIAIQNGAMTAWSVTGPDQRQISVPLGSTGTAQIYVVAQSAAGYGPLGDPVTVTP